MPSSLLLRGFDTLAQVKPLEPCLPAMRTVRTLGVLSREMEVKGSSGSPSVSERGRAGSALPKLRSLR